MSWRALNWAAEQKTGSPHAKLLLLLLANRANEDGICWPSQIGLSEQSEQSDDTVQRHLLGLQNGGFIVRVRARRTQGRWPGYIYQLRMSDVPAADRSDLQDRPRRNRKAREDIERAKADPLPAAAPGCQHETTPLSAAWSGPLSAVSPGRSQRFHRAAESGVEPSVEPSCETSQLEPSRAAAAVVAGLRPAALQRRGAARKDLIQNEIAQRLGRAGWAILQDLRPEQLAQLEDMQRKGNLTDRALEELRNTVERIAVVGEAGPIRSVSTS